MERTFVLNNQLFRENELKEFSVSMLENLLGEMQEGMHNFSKEKMKLMSLPPDKRNNKTWAKVMKIKSEMMDLQDAQCWVSKIRKLKKDTFQTEFEFYKEFYQVSKTNIRKGLFEKLQKKTFDKTGVLI